MLIKFIYDKYYYYYKNSKKYNRLFKSKPQLIIILPFQISKIYKLSYELLAKQWDIL